jgi:hypothetical protein
LYPQQFARSLVESAEIVPNSHSPHGNSEVRKDVSNRSLLAGCTQEIADRAPGTIARFDEAFRVREICEIPT